MTSRCARIVDRPVLLTDKRPGALRLGQEQVLDPREGTQGFWPRLSFF